MAWPGLMLDLALFLQADIFCSAKEPVSYNVEYTLLLRTEDCELRLNNSIVLVCSCSIVVRMVLVVVSLLKYAGSTFGP